MHGRLDRGQFDAREWLHRDGPKVGVVILLAVLLVELLRALTPRLATFSRQQTLPSLEADGRTAIAAGGRRG